MKATDLTAQADNLEPHAMKVMEGKKHQYQDGTTLVKNYHQLRDDAAEANAYAEQWQGEADVLVIEVEKHARSKQLPLSDD